MNGLYKIEIFGFEQRARSLVLTAVMLCIRAQGLVGPLSSNENPSISLCD
jgi:hypothetical protein